MLTTRHLKQTTALALALPAGALAIFALATAAPAAAAGTQPLSATYTEKFIAPHGPSRCPADAFACGSGTGVGLAFTTEQTFDEICGCVVRTLTFSDGSTLVLDEEFVSFTGPGNSGSSNAPPTSSGHPGSYAQSWTVESGTGSFSGATGNGTDDYLSAGLIATGTISGTITTP